MNTFKTALVLVTLAAIAAASGTSPGTGTGIGTGTGYAAGTAAASRRGPQPERAHFLSGTAKGVANTLNPLNWLNKVAEHVPKVEDISFSNLVSLPMKQASLLIKAIMFNSYVQQWTGYLYSPKWNNVKFNLITGNGNVSVQLNSISQLKRYQQLASGEVTVFVTGFPSNLEQSSDSVDELIEAYRERYHIGQQQEERSNPWESATVGNLIVCDLGDELTTFKQWATLDIEDCGKHIGQAIVDLAEFVPYYSIHLIGHSQGAHVVGSAAKYFSQKTDKQIRRVTGLDPNKPYTRAQHVQSELARGVADFVDVIHTTSSGVASNTNGDADFYPNGKGAAVNGAENIIDASLKSIEYFAETVRPGGERNFMAAECNSLEAYDNRQCHGIRVPMGYATPVDTKGDFVLRVNSNAPYGKNHGILKNNRSRSSLYI